MIDEVRDNVFGPNFTFNLFPHSNPYPLPGLPNFQHVRQSLRGADNVFL